MEMECAAEFIDVLPRQQAGQELDHELLDTRGRDIPVQGMRWWSAIDSDGALGVPPVDGDLDGQAPVPPGHAPVPGAGERPRPGAGVGGPEDVTSPLPLGEVPARQLS